MSGAQEPVGTLEIALAHAAKLLVSEPALAAEQASEILKVAPGHPVATMMLAAAPRAQDRPTSARDARAPCPGPPDWVSTHYEIALALGLLGRPARRPNVRRAMGLKPEMGDAWRALGGNLTALGDTAGADAAYAKHIRASTRDPRLLNRRKRSARGASPRRNSCSGNTSSASPPTCWRSVCWPRLPPGWPIPRLRDAAAALPGNRAGLRAGPA